MKKATFSDAKKTRFFGGKGFYVALAVCLTAVGGAAWIGVNAAMDRIQPPPPVKETPQNQTEPMPHVQWEENNARITPADTKKDDIAMTKPAAGETPADTAVEQGYILPIKGEILNSYSGDKVVKSKTLDDWVMHTGIDIAAPVSTPVKAMSAGRVVSIKNDSLWGTTVTIEHTNKLISYYANLKSAVNVNINQAVKLGDVIGAVGETCDIERAEQSHLHFGVKKNDNWTDPMAIIK